MQFKRKNKNWWIWCIFWGLLAWSGYDLYQTGLSLPTGGDFMYLILSGLSVCCFFYEMYTNSDSYIGKYNAEVRKAIEAAKRAEERTEILDISTRMPSIYARFGNLNIVKDVVNQLCYEDANNRFNVTVCKSQISVGYKTWKFNDYGYNNLDIEGCKDLTYYFIYLFKKQSRFKVREVHKVVGGYNPVNEITDAIASAAGYHNHGYDSDGGPDLVDGYQSYDTIPVSQTRKNI